MHATMHHVTSYNNSQIATINAHLNNYSEISSQGTEQCDQECQKQILCHSLQNALCRHPQYTT